jgi:ATP-dependent DNA helicase RecG
LLVNALAHRDYLVSAPIRLFIFDNRIEVVSPGHLPDNLTVEKIRAGNSNIRNPILVSYVAKGLLPYHGLGSGIKRALEKWPAIDFADDHDGCLFTATVHRKAAEELELVNIAPEISPKVDTASGKRRVSVGKTSGKILAACREKPSITIPELAELIGITERSVQRNIQNLQKDGWLRRIGGRKEGHWEVME